jgi:hypothetical protein
VRSDIVIDEPPFDFDPMSPKIEPVDSAWIAENMTENVARFKEALRP